MDSPFLWAFQSLNPQSLVDKVVSSSACSRICLEKSIEIDQVLGRKRGDYGDFINKNGYKDDGEVDRK